MFERLFDSSFMPHGHCYQWQSGLVWLHAGSDALISFAYFTIPFLLIYFVSKRREIEFKRIFVMFGAFILLCGATHLLEIWSIWNGTYWLTGSVKLLTGLVSSATAVMLVAAVPQALKIPSPRQLEVVNHSLRSEIEARKNVERALRESEERFREAFDHAAIGKALVGRDGRWLQVNETLCQITGYERDELLDLTFQDITHRDDLDADMRLVRQMLRGEIRTYQLEKRYIRKDGEFTWVLLAVSAVRDEDGQVRYFIVEATDITEQKKWQAHQARLLEEVEAERDKLRQAEQSLEQINTALKSRNSELQEFAYVASHDLQEPLRKISAFSDLLREDQTADIDETTRSYVDRIQSAALRMSQLLSDLVDFSRVTIHTDSFEAVDLNAVVADVIHDLELTITSKNARIRIGELPEVQADAIQMAQLFRNVIGNALKYSRDGVPPSVEVSVTQYQDDACTIVVEDNGIGFDGKYADRIFAPFERLLGRRYEGTGMGLAICRRIVERHDGRIWAESESGEGTRIFIQLPTGTADDRAQTDGSS